jgi:hypothetical protein
MTSYAESQQYPLGSKIWTYFPTKSEIASIKRIAFYTVIPGLVMIAGMIFGLIQMNPRLGWKEGLLVMIASSSFLVTGRLIWRGAMRRQDNRLIFYEQGVINVHAAKQHFARYEDLKIWQSNIQYTMYGVPSLKTERQLRLRFPDGYLFTIFDQDFPQGLQDSIVQAQLSQALYRYEQGESIDFSPIQVGQDGIAINTRHSVPCLWRGFTGRQMNQPTSRSFNKFISWPDLHHVELNQERLFFKTMRNQSVRSFSISDIPNIDALVNFLNHLGALQIVADSTEEASNDHWYNIMFGLGILGPGNFWAYNYFTQLEMEGSTRRINWLFALAYQLAGKGGIVILLTLIAVCLIGRGIQGLCLKEK